MLRRNRLLTHLSAILALFASAATSAMDAEVPLVPVDLLTLDHEPAGEDCDGFFVQHLPAKSALWLRYPRGDHYQAILESKEMHLRVIGYTNDGRSYMDHVDLFKERNMSVGGWVQIINYDFSAHSRIEDPVIVVHNENILPSLKDDMFRFGEGTAQGQKDDVDWIAKNLSTTFTLSTVKTLKPMYLSFAQPTPEQYMTGVCLPDPLWLGKRTLGEIIKNLFPADSKGLDISPRGGDLGALGEVAAMTSQEPAISPQRKVIPRSKTLSPRYAEEWAKRLRKRKGGSSSNKEEPKT